MVIKLDLRIPGRDNNEEGDQSYRHLAVFSIAALFFISAFMVYLLIAWKTVSLNSKKTELTAQISELSGKLAMIDAEFSKLSSANAQLESEIDFMLSDVPSVEFMSALFTLIPEGLAVESLKMTNSDLNIVGTASTEEAVVTFAANLASSHFMTEAPMPDIKRAEAGSAGKFSYTIQGKLNPLIKIIDERSRPATGMSSNVSMPEGAKH